MFLTTLCARFASAVVALLLFTLGTSARAVIPGSDTVYAGEPVVEWQLFDPAVIAVTRTSPVEFKAKVSGDPSSLEFQFENGTNVPLSNIGGDIWTAMVPASALLFDYTPDDVNHNFVGFLVVFKSGMEVERRNVVMQVIDSNIPAVPIVPVGPDSRRTRNVVNLRIPDTAPELTFICQAFYDSFGDDYDFLNVVSSLPCYPGNRIHVVIKNDVEGIGLGMRDATSLYGSSGRLCGINCYPIDSFFDLALQSSSHEIGHQWINYCTLPVLSGSAHWPISSLARGIMGYADATGQGVHFPYQLEPRSGGVYRMVSAPLLGEFTDLDLYLMGLLPAAEVGPHVVFTDPNQQVCNGCEGPTVTITVDDLIAVQGLRVPSASTSPKNFRVATIVVTRERLLNDEEMAYFHHFTVRGEATERLLFSEGRAKGVTNPFFVATRSLGSLTTDLTPEGVALDIKPGSCPNALNVRAVQNTSRKDHPGRGVMLPVALLGTENFDVNDIDISTLLLEGVAPVRHGYEDVSAPPDDRERCECTTAGPDGHVDLTLKFQESRIVATLGAVSRGDVLSLTLTGRLRDRTEFEATDCVTIVNGELEGVDSFYEEETILGPAVPNPFNPTTTISLTLPERMRATLAIYDVEGRLVRTLVEGIVDEGYQERVWDGKDASGDPVGSGVYFCRLTAGDETLTKKMVMIR